MSNPETKTGTSQSFKHTDLPICIAIPLPLDGEQDHTAWIACLWNDSQ